MMRMPHIPPYIPWLTTALTSIAAVTLHFGVYSWSFDFAIHHSVVATIMRDGGLQPQHGRFLGGMVSYPPLSHWLAALGGYVLRASTVSLAGVAIAAVFGAYAVIAAFLAALGGRRAAVAGLVMIALVAVGRFGQAILGFEIVANFFYAQAVAGTLTLVGYWIAYRLHYGALPSVVRDLVVFFFVWVIAWAHLLPALQLGVAYGIIVSLEALRDGWSSRKLRSLLRPVLFALLMLVLLHLHPAFEEMRINSLNDGALEFAFRTNAVTLGMVGLIGFTVSALCIISGVRAGGLAQARSEGVKVFVGAWGMGAVLLLIAQALALTVGQGSPYAVKKHVFAVGTAILVGCSILLADALARRQQGSPWPDRYPGGLGLIAVPLFGWACLALILPAKPVVSLKNLETFRSFALGASSHLPVPEASGGVIAVDSGMPAVFSYLVTMGDLRYPWDSNSLDLIDGKWFVGKPERIAAAVVDRGNLELDVQECRVSGLESERYVVVRYGCAVAVRDRPVGPGVFSFRGAPMEGSPGRRFLRAGWSWQETIGIWSVGSKSTLAFVVDTDLQGRPLSVEFHLTPFLAPGHSTVTVELVGNGNPIEARQFSGTGLEARVWSVLLPKEMVGDDHKVELAFMVRSPASPASLGLSIDARPLGVMLQELRLSTVTDS